MSLDENTQIFITESHELLDDMEDALLELERNPNDADLINRVFRAAHTIKGSAGLFGFDNIISFTHAAENLLDDVRDCLVPVTEELVSLLMKSRDHIVLLIDGLASGKEADPDEESELKGMLAQFRAGAAPSQPGTGGVTGSGADTGEGVARSERWHISLRLHRDTFRQGFNPAVMFSQLHELGDIERAKLVSLSVPALAELDAEDCYLGWEIELNSAADKQAIADVFEFIDGAVVYILPPKSLLSDFQELLGKLPEDDLVLGALLVEIGALTESELQQALNEQKDEGGLTGDILVEKGAVQPEVVETALARQQQIRADKQRERSFVRVDAQKLDKLVTLVGEMVISGAKVAQLADDRNDDELAESVEEMTISLEDMRETALGLRMVPVANTFNRFHRVVRDTAKDLGKHIRLEVLGGETELDKTVVESIADPLTHLIRNAMDHGIESPAVRLKAGKPEEGVIRLEAGHETGTIVIEISDDGAGLDAGRIRALAEERGLVRSSDVLGEKDIFNLIFEPGFSTADSVSNLSGRGVGMDVVRRNIEGLRGSVSVSSEAGKGSTVNIRLPLTLAIIDGFHVSVAGEPFIIPLDMMVECITMNDEQKSEAGLHDYINLRDEVLPLIRMSAYMGLDGVETGSGRVNVVVVQFAGKKLGLLVDELHSEIQAVIKPLGRVFQGLEGFAGFTILGNGQVALILDVPGVIKDATRREKESQDRLRRTAGGDSGADSPALLH